MSNPLTYLNSLFDAFADKTLSGHDQLVMLHIFNQFNRSHWTRTVRISDSELLKLCRLYDSTGKPITLDTLRTVKSRLKLKGFIDFKSGKGNAPTEYRLANPPDSPAESPRDTPQETPTHSAQISYSRTREDVKTLDVKTEKTQSAGVRETLKQVDSPDELGGDIGEFWLRQTGFRLTGDLAFDLCKKADDDRKLTEAAIVKAMGSKPTYVLKYDHFKKVYDSLKAPKTKGGESSAKSSVDFTYKPVEFDYDEPLW